jgi:hypothetical protein
MQTDVEHCNLLTATPDGAAITIATALTDPRDLLRLARACRRFATKCIAAPATAAAAQQTEMWSFAAEAARQWIASCTDQERGWVPRRGRESWLALMWEVVSLCRALVFGRSHNAISRYEGGARALMSVAGWGHVAGAAASMVVMRAGLHYARFTLVHGVLLCCGVIRPAWNATVGWGAELVPGHWFYRTDDWLRFPGRYPGQTAFEEGDHIGLLLDLDQGSLTVYKNDEWVGVMETPGLSGAYCWAVSTCYPGGMGYTHSPAWYEPFHQGSVRISHSPTGGPQPMA